MRILRKFLYITALAGKLAFQSWLAFGEAVALGYLQVKMSASGLEPDCGLVESCEVASGQHIR